MTKPMTFSASRISTWMNCNRKAAWQYFCGYPDLGSVDTEIGKAVHARLENLGRTRQLPDRTDQYEAIAAEALPYLEEHFSAPGVQFEGEISVRGRHLWTGFRDLHPRPGLVVDYKTTTDFRWAKSSEDLQYDPQAILYAESEFRAYPELADVGLLWLYLKKRKPFAALPVEAKIARPHSAKSFEALEQFADEMQAAAYACPEDVVARHKYVLQVIQPNFSHCDAYRGCPHRMQCPDSPLIRDPNNTKGTTMNLLQKLTSMSETVNAGGNPLAVVATPPSNMTVALAESLVQGPAAEEPPPTPPATPAAITVHINPPRKGPGRPRKTHPAPPTPPQEMLSANLAPAAPPATSSNTTDTMVAAIVDHSPSAAPIQTLFVGAFPRLQGIAALSSPFPTQYEDFDNIVRHAKEMITPEVYFAKFGYQSNGLLLDAIQRIVAQRRPNSLVIMDPRTPEATLCLSYLRSAAEVVVESVR